MGFNTQKLLCLQERILEASAIAPPSSSKKRALPPLTPTHHAEANVKERGSEMQPWQNGTMA